MTTWVPILVRLEDYGEIAALIAEREASRVQPVTRVIDTPTDAPSAILDPDDAQLATWTPWPIEELRALAEGTSETAKRWTRAMDVCSAVADTDHKWLSTSEVAARSGMSINEWRDAPRKISRHLRANYPRVPRDDRGDHIWPLLAMGKPGSHEVHWAMNSEQAGRWRAVRRLEL